MEGGKPSRGGGEERERRIQHRTGKEERRKGRVTGPLCHCPIVWSLLGGFAHEVIGEREKKKLMG